jgi:TPR repeat protein
MMDRGELRTAFRLFLAAAKARDRASQVRVGHCYDTGSGTRPNRAAALYWYKRAYRRGDASAANNIGTIWRDQQKWRRARSWFQRSVKLGNEDANLRIAESYLQSQQDTSKAISYLKKVCQSNCVTEASAAEAERLLKKLRRVKVQGYGAATKTARRRS